MKAELDDEPLEIDSDGDFVASDKAEESAEQS